MSLLLNTMNQNIYHLAELFFWMLGAFVIGLIFGRIISKKSKKKTVTHEEFFEDIGEEDFSKIRATKTFERGGKEMPLKSNSIEKYDLVAKPVVDSDTNKDDLQQIKGIGDVMESKLNELGISTFEHISQLSEADIQLIAEKINYSEQRIMKDDWIGQARSKIKK